MSMGIASLVCVALLIVSFAHFMWGFGRKWPVADEAMLARTIVGRPGVTRMPPWYRSLALAILTFAAAVYVLAVADHDAGGGLMTLIGFILGAIFLARGLAGYLPPWRRAHPDEPFRTNDIRFYSPLSLVIGLGFLILTIMRLT